MQASCMLTRTNKYVADTLQTLPHPHLSVFPYCSQAKGLWDWGVVSWEHTVLSSMSLSCLIHSFYHLIRRMWRCGGEALSPWDRKGGATLRLFLPWPGGPLCMLAACMDNTAPGGVGGASCRMSALHRVTHSSNGLPWETHGCAGKWENCWQMVLILFLSTLPTPGLFDACLIFSHEYFSFVIFVFRGVGSLIPLYIILINFNYN